MLSNLDKSIMLEWMLVHGTLDGWNSYDRLRQQILEEFPQLIQVSDVKRVNEAATESVLKELDRSLDYFDMWKSLNTKKLVTGYEERSKNILKDSQSFRQYCQESYNVELLNSE